MEELRLGLAGLEDGEDGAEIRDRPFHDDFVFPVELTVAALVGGPSEGAGSVPGEGDFHGSAGSAAVRLVDRVFRRVLRFALGGRGGCRVRGAEFRRLGGLRAGFRGGLCVDHGVCFGVKTQGV